MHISANHRSTLSPHWPLASKQHQQQRQVFPSNHSPLFPPTPAIYSLPLLRLSIHSTHLIKVKALQLIGETVRDSNLSHAGMRQSAGKCKSARKRLPPATTRWRYTATSHCGRPSRVTDTDTRCWTVDITASEASRGGGIRLPKLAYTPLPPTCTFSSHLFALIVIAYQAGESRKLTASTKWPTYTTRDSDHYEILFNWTTPTETLPRPF